MYIWQTCNVCIHTPDYITLHDITLRNAAQCYTTLHCICINHITVQYSTLHTRIHACMHHRQSISIYTQYTHVNM